MGIMTIRELNANVSQAIARVEKGETLDISKHGKIVAEMRPKRPVRDAAWHDRYDRMLALMEKGADLGGGPLTMEDRYGDAQL